MECVRLWNFLFFLLLEISFVGVGGKMSPLSLRSSEPRLVRCVPSLRSMRNELVSSHTQKNLSTFSNFFFYNMIIPVLSASVIVTFGGIYFKRALGALRG